MKKLFAITLMMVLAMNGIAQETHYDFSVINSTGYEFFYRIIDEQNHWVEITYPCQNGDNYYWGYDKPEGKLILADTVVYQDTDYFLVAVGDHAFCDCTGLRGTLEFPESIQTIGAGAFKGCSNLSGDLVLPTSILRLEEETFYGCSGLAGNLILSDSLTFLGDYAFYNCSQLSGLLTVPNKVTTIGNHVFENCHFRGRMTLPATLQSIGEAAFKGMTAINAISIKATVPPTVGNYAFEGIASWITIAVPYATKEAYQNAPGWSVFSNKIIEKSYWNGLAEPWTKGSGTTDDPYLIESAENLAWLAKTVNERQDVVTTHSFSPGGVPFDNYEFKDVDVYQDTCFRVVIDIDLGKSIGLLWNPIGNFSYINPDDLPSQATYHSSHFYYNEYINYDYDIYYYYYTYFSGQFDGNGHEISKLHCIYDFPSIFYRSDYHSGLFGLIDQALVQNVTINDIQAASYSYTTGAIAGKAYSSTITNCNISGTVMGSYCGGIVGLAKNCRIESCTTRIDLDAKEGGGIVGILVCDTANASQDGVFNCGFIGKANNSPIMGGIVGQCKSITDGMGVIRIENCFSRGKFTYTNSYFSNNTFGGIIGKVDDIDTLRILNCYSNDTISTPVTNHTTNYYAGGILGYADANTTLVIKNCYHAGPITSQHTGGILAQNTNMTIVRNCYFEQSSAPDDGFGLPLESDYMKTEAFVTRLNNGSTVFKMDTEPYENGGYPVFGTDGLVFVGAEWYYEILNDDGSITYQHLQCTGDTVVQGKRPKIIVRSNTQYDKAEAEVTHEYIYEENGVVYWWNNALQTFTVLYDFGAEVGDTWEIKVGNESIVTRVYAIDTQMVDGTPYKRLTIGDENNLFSGTLISTIGHTTSFFPERLMTRGMGYHVEGLRCYWLDGDLLLKIGNEDCDAVYQQYHNGVDENGPSTGTETLVVYPNPANDVLFVETHGRASLSNQTYRITNLMGQTLISGQIETRRATSLQIDISSLPAGMYFISMGGQTVKFVVR